MSELKHLLRDVGLGSYLNYIYIPFGKRVPNRIIAALKEIKSEEEKIREMEKEKEKLEDEIALKMAELGKKKVEVLKSLLDIGYLRG